jgi:hypothetical protein
VSDLAAIARLRAIAARLRDREDPDAPWFDACLALYETGAAHGLALADAFELRLAPGERPWWAREACDKRDQLLRQVKSEYFPGRSGRAASAAILQALNHYEVTGWLRHKVFFAPPSEVDALDCDLFALLKLQKIAPTTAATIRRALAHETGAIRAPRAAATSGPPSEDTNGSSSEIQTDARSGRDSVPNARG